MLLLERIIIASEEAVWDRVDIYRERLCMLLLERIIIASEEAVWDRVVIETLYAIARVYNNSQ